MSEPRPIVFAAQAAPASVQRFADIVATLRSPDGCPWDREQTHGSLAKYAVEESYELVDAIESGDDDELREELGDVLLQVVLHAQLAAERGAFTLQDVIDGIDAKMIRRHPHVFGEAVGASREEIEAQWKASKRAEGKTLLGGVPRSMPALERAHRVTQKVAGVGFDWSTPGAVLQTLRDEVEELAQAIADGDVRAAGDELGDVLLTCASLGRHIGVEASSALGRTVDRFVARFGHVEERLLKAGRTLEEASLDEMDALWDEAKEAERGG